MQLVKDSASQLAAVVRRLFEKERKLELFSKDFLQNKKPLASGLSGSALSFFVDALIEKGGTKSPLVIVLSDDQAVRELWSDLSFLWPLQKMKNLFTMSASTPLTYRFETANPEILMGLASLGILRIEQEQEQEHPSAKKTKRDLSKQEDDPNTCKVYLLSATQLVYRITPFELFAKRTIKLSLGERYAFAELRSFLDQNGYMRVARVDCPGEYAQRGDILDVYCPYSNLPLRLYFFDDELEEIRFFSVDTQKSIKGQQVSHAYFCPFQGELGEEKRLNALLEKLKEYEGDAFHGISDIQVLLSQLKEKLRLLSNPTSFPHDFSYYSYLLHGDKSQTLFDYFHALKACMLWVDPDLCLAGIDDFLQSHDSQREAMKNEGMGQCKDGDEKKIEEVFQSIFLPSKKVFYADDIFNAILKDDWLKVATVYYNQLPQTSQLAQTSKSLETPNPPKVSKKSKKIIAENEKEEGEMYSFSLLPTDLHKENLAAAKQAFTHRLEMKEQLWLLSHHGHSLERLAELFSDLEKKPLSLGGDVGGSKEGSASGANASTESIFDQDGAGADVGSNAADNVDGASGGGDNAGNASVDSADDIGGTSADSAGDADTHRASSAGKTLIGKASNKVQENTSRFFIAEGRLSRGFQCAGFSLWLDHEIFGRRVKRSLSYAAKKEAWLDNFFDLKEDQYVVHVNQGIGIYRGLKRLKTDEMEKDYLKIEYADNSYLFVPVEQLSMVQKYVGSEGEKKLDKLGGRSWDNLKKRVKKNVESLARELIALYSKRAANSNTPFGKDDVFQQEFELRFPFEETEDQLRVAQEIKDDLEKSRVMDRLLCADVGFGKTEVALRAIFKAVMNGFQCVFLVPTTILSMQHYRNFVERFKDFPISMVVLNRFVSVSEQAEVFGKITSGATDVVIATHKIFSEKIAFKNLGLFVIDEEQKFGVKQKEHLKKRYPHVNTLSLSATPIPRTLHMSMSGIRDISFIHTPPHGRKQVEVRVLAYDHQIVKSVIQKEVKRGGQVFFVHNFVQTIASIKGALQKILPEVSMEYVHGQMKEEEIRSIITRFLDRKIDVLVTTAIIENGIDIRNANTLLVHHAERFGLSQLYQLKGRVGRGDEKAYAYFFYPRGATLSKTAMKRLRFLNETTHLGSGFSLAMRDLEIRGAGNLLGPQQSGSIAAVGYELYCKLLQETVEEVRAEKPNEEDSDFLHLSTVVDLRYDGFVSDDFIDDNVEKVRLYRRIASLESQEQIEECMEEIVDRFGPYPAAIEKLLAIAKLRIAAAKVYVLSIVERMEHVEITFNQLLLNSKKQAMVVLREKIFNSIEKKWVVPMPEHPNQVKMSLAGFAKDFQSSSLTLSEKKKKRDEFFWAKHKKLMGLVDFWLVENGKK